MEEKKIIQEIADIVRKCGQIMLDAEHVKETADADAGGSITQLDGDSITFDRPCSILACGSGVTDDEKMLEHSEAAAEASSIKKLLK